MQGARHLLHIPRLLRGSDYRWLPHMSAITMICGHSQCKPTAGSPPAMIDRRRPSANPFTSIRTHLKSTSKTIFHASIAVATAALLPSCVAPYPGGHQSSVSAGYEIQSLPSGYRTEIVGGNRYYVHGNTSYSSRVSCLFAFMSDQAILHSESHSSSVPELRHFPANRRQFHRSPFRERACGRGQALPAHGGFHAI